MLPEIQYAQCNPGDSPLHGDYAFEIAVRPFDLLELKFRSDI